MSDVVVEPGRWVRILKGPDYGRRGKVVAVKGVHVTVEAYRFVHGQMQSRETTLRHDQVSRCRRRGETAH
jgi:ribosomal protein L24